MENKNFNQQLARSGASMYKISKRSGVPYTTLSRLKNNLLDMNSCSYETVARLAVYFHCSVADITNPVEILRNCSGTYGGFHYRWEVRDGKEILHITDNGEDVILRTASGLTQVRFADAYIAMTENYIDIYKKKKEVEKLLCSHTR